MLQIFGTLMIKNNKIYDFNNYLFYVFAFHIAFRIIKFVEDRILNKLLNFNIEDIYCNIGSKISSLLFIENKVVNIYVFIKV